MKKFMTVLSVALSMLVATNVNSQAGVLTGINIISGVPNVIAGPFPGLPRDRCAKSVNKSKKWETCCIAFPLLCADVIKDRCKERPESVGCTLDCITYPKLAECKKPRGGDDNPGNGVSEPLGILSALTAISLFFVSRRRKV